jgi:hypothetical protein
MLHNLLQNVVVVFVVAAESYLSAENQSVREEDLCHCINPYLLIEHTELRAFMKLERIILSNSINFSRSKIKPI